MYMRNEKKILVRSLTCICTWMFVRIKNFLPSYYHIAFDSHLKSNKIHSRMITQTGFIMRGRTRKSLWDRIIKWREYFFISSCVWWPYEGKNINKPFIRLECGALVRRRHGIKADAMENLLSSPWKRREREFFSCTHSKLLLNSFSI